jgi:hypothetical protein
MIVTVSCQQRGELSFLYKLVDLEDRKSQYTLYFPIQDLLSMSSMSLYELNKSLMPCLQINEGVIEVDSQMRVKCLLNATDSLLAGFEETSSPPLGSFSHIESSPKQGARNVIMNSIKAIKKKQKAGDPTKSFKFANKTTDDDSLSSSETSLDKLIAYKNDTTRLDEFAKRIQRRFRGALARKRFKELYTTESIVMFKKTFIQHDFESVSCTILKKLSSHEYTIYGYNFDRKCYLQPESFTIDESDPAAVSAIMDPDYFENVLTKTYFDNETRTLYFQDFLIEDPSALVVLKRNDHNDAERRKAELFMVKLSRKNLSGNQVHEKVMPHYEQRYNMVGKRTFKMESTIVSILVA